MAMSDANGTGLSVNVASSVSTVSYGYDNTAVFQTAGAMMNTASAAGKPVCIYVPNGNYLVQPLTIQLPGTGQPAPFKAKGYGCWLGDEHYNSNIFVVPNQAGDVFAWVDSNVNAAQVPFGNTQTFTDFHGTGPNSSSGNQAGSSFRNITIFGNRFSSAQQNALMFYGKTSYAYISNCGVSYLYGRAFGGGLPNGGSPVSLGTFTESRIQDCYFDDTGDGPAGLPTFEITGSTTSTTKGVDAPNTVTLNNIRIFDSWGPGMWIHTQGLTNSNVRVFQLLNVVIEGSGMSELAASGDLLKFGDSSGGSGLTNNIGDVTCRNVALLNPLGGYAALRVVETQYNAGNTQNIDCEAAITGTFSSLGRGIQLDGCQNCAFKTALNTATDYPFVLGTPDSLNATCSGSRQLGGGSGAIIYDGNGQEATQANCIDPLAAALVQFPVRQTYLTANAVAAPVTSVRDLVATSTVTTGESLTVGATTPVFPIDPKYSTWTLLRSGPTADFTDTWDNAVHFSGALVPANGVGVPYHARICNMTKYNETLHSPGGSVTFPDTIVSPSSCHLFTLTITSNGAGGSSYLMTIVAG